MLSYYQGTVWSYSDLQWICYELQALTQVTYRCTCGISDSASAMNPLIATGDAGLHALSPLIQNFNANVSETSCHSFAFKQMIKVTSKTAVPSTGVKVLWRGMLPDNVMMCILRPTHPYLRVQTAFSQGTLKLLAPWKPVRDEMLFWHHCSVHSNIIQYDLLCSW